MYPESRQLVIQYRLPWLRCGAGCCRIQVRQDRGQDHSEGVSRAGAPGPLQAGSLRPSPSAPCMRCSRPIDPRSPRLSSFNGHVDTVNEATGKQEYPCLVTLMTTRASFMDRDFARIDPLACLLDLSASVSKNPAELAPVRPVLEFDMVDPRFVEEADVLSGLDQRPNLMDLKPGEFESLITNLFTKMGLETRQTQASRDGGVDCVAFDNRPVFGGKVVIQAKRYKNTVPVSAVRDLFGSVHNEGASKGILVTTSGYGQGVVRVRQRTSPWSSSPAATCCTYSRSTQMLTPRLSPRALGRAPRRLGITPLGRAQRHLTHSLILACVVGDSARPTFVPCGVADPARQPVGQAHHAGQQHGD